VSINLPLINCFSVPLNVTTELNKGVILSKKPSIFLSPIKYETVATGKLLAELVI
jgi:hypothetical protein